MKKLLVAALVAASMLAAAPAQAVDRDGWVRERYVSDGWAYVKNTTKKDIRVACWWYVPSIDQAMSAKGRLGGFEKGWFHTGTGIEDLDCWVTRVL
jgi:hypothetical protein